MPALSREERVWYPGNVYKGGNPADTRAPRFFESETGQLGSGELSDDVMEALAEGPGFSAHLVYCPDESVAEALSSDDPDEEERVMSLLPASLTSDWTPDEPLPAGWEYAGRVESSLTVGDSQALVERQLNAHAFPADKRVVVVATVTSPPGERSLAQELAEKVFAYLKNETQHDPRIDYQLQVYHTRDRIFDTDDDVEYTDVKVRVAISQSLQTYLLTRSLFSSKLV